MHLISIIYLLTSFYTSIITTDYTNMYEKDQTNELSVILEVDRDVNEVVREIENNYPKLEIITTYQLLFQGIALRGDRYSIQKLSAEHYIQSVFPVQAYVQLRGNRTIKNEMFEQATLPEEINQTSYTGKGVKVAVIDTGVDMTHPDLINNYKGGFDLVDLDDTPQETTLEEGLPTSHGTHVAGIIAANGTIKGVAPDAEIYAYRALGPGGVGTSVQVIAALEEAVKAGVDIINLSLGNHVNGPDYPTSRAVNEASKLGAIVVVANGNSGPQPWTVGSPATATNAFSIGAFEEEQMHTYLTDHRSRRQIKLYPFMQSPAWNFSNSYEITFDTEVQNVFGKMVFIDEWEGNIEQTIENLKRSGAIAIVTNQASAIQITHELGQLETALPIAFIGENDKRYIQNLIHSHDQTYFRLTERRADETIAHFSSRGPVTLNWNIKPNVIAPGVNVLSTVPGGYAAFSGTSMAAPHVAGAIALLKEAKPHWSNEQIIAAIETSARKLYNQSGEIIPASVQGTGVIQIDKALTATTLIENGLLTFGKVNKIVEEKRTDITIYNESNETKHYYFTHPENVSGLSWNMPLAFTIKPHSKKTIPIGLKVNRHLMKNEVEEGWITLNSDEEKFSLPYIVVNEPSNYVKISGFHFQLHPLQKSKFEYQLYVAEDVEQIEVKLFDRESLLYETTILTLKDVHAGYHEGELLEKDVTVRGQFYGIILVTLKNGSIVPYEIELQI